MLWGDSFGSMRRREVKVCAVGNLPMGGNRQCSLIFALTTYECNLLVQLYLWPDQCSLIFALSSAVHQCSLIFAWISIVLAEPA